MSYYGEYGNDDELAIVLFMLFQIVIVLACCVFCPGEGLIIIGIFKILVSFLMLGMGEQDIAPSAAFGGILWIYVGKKRMDKHRADLAAMMENSETGGETAGAAVTGAAAQQETTLQNSRGASPKRPRSEQQVTTRRRGSQHYASVPSHLVEEDHRNHSDAIYARVILPGTSDERNVSATDGGTTPSMPGIRFGGDVGTAGVDQDPEDSRERGIV